jgi:hypothetical protein
MAVQESFLSKVSDAVSSGTVEKEVKRSAVWFKDKIKGLKGELRNRFSKTNARTFYRESSNKFVPDRLGRRMNMGDMFCYWYNPKYKMSLPYYDMFPIVMLIGFEKETFLGLNFHYLRPQHRAMLLDRVTAKIGNALPKWSKLAKLPYIEPTIHRYRYDHVMKKIIPIEKNEQELAIFLPLERFKKASKTKVWGISSRRK